MKITSYQHLLGANLNAADLLIAVAVADQSMAPTGSTRAMEAAELAVGLAKMPTAINSQSDSYQLVDTDAGKIIEMTKGTAQTLTVPAYATVPFPTGTSIMVIQYGAGALTISPAGGVTIRKRSVFTFVLAGQYAEALLVKRGQNEWTLGGDLAAA